MTLPLFMQEEIAMSTRFENDCMRVVKLHWPIVRRCSQRLRLAAAMASVLFCFVAWPPAAEAGTLIDARYEVGDNELVLEIAYQGTNPHHQFVLEWGSCRRDPDGSLGAVARLIDSDGHDIARENYRVWRRFDLSGLDCRPADVTVRLGPVSNRTVYVPPEPRRENP
jgi:hypothetical protein